MTRDNRHLLIGSLPAALLGVFNLGRQALVSPLQTGESWQMGLLAGLGLETGAIAAFLLGALLWLPILVSLLIVGYSWSVIFARSRGRSIDPVWIPTAWLLALMLPATVPVGFAVVALSFGLVFGCHAFGGTGRYPANPALLAIVFLAIGYPALVGSSGWVPGDDPPSTWSIVGSDADSALMSELSLSGAFFGNEVGAIGTTSAAACLLGAIYLVAMRLASVRLIVGGLVALFTLGMVHGQPPWSWHFAAGNFAFALAFVASDPTTRPSTSAGTWLYGALFGGLTFALRIGNPDHPEGSWAALLLASLCVPLLDHLARTIGGLKGRAQNV